MRKWNCGFVMVGLAFLISISVLSCQTDDADDYSQQAEDVTAADLFIASEAYQNLEKEIGKDMRREQNAISKLSKEDLEQYRLLRKNLLNIETRTEAITQLKILTGYDYQANRNRISSLVRDVFKDADFTKLDAIAPIHLDSKFALVDENNNYLEIVGKGSIGHDSTTNGVTNSFEFKLKDKDIKSLRLIPIKYIGEENRILDIYDIDKLPITFEMNEYGKVIIEDIQINDSKIIYTYYTEGFVPYESGLVFFDENEKEIGFSCSSSENKNKKTGRITTTINLEGYGNDLNLISKIKKVSAYNNTKMRLLYDEAIEINLSN